MLSKIAYYIIVLLILVSGDAAAYDTLKVEASLDTLKKQIHGSVEYILPAAPEVTTFEFQMFPSVYSSESSPYLKAMPGLLRRYKETNTWGEMIIDSVLLDRENVTVDVSTDYTRGILTASSGNLNGKNIKIFFKTVIPGSGNRLVCFGNDYTLDGWFPVPAIPESDGRWYSPTYGPFAELVGDYFHYKISLIVPGNLKIAAPVPPSVVSDRDTLTEYDFSFGPAHDFAVALSPDYLVDTFLVGETTVRVFYRNFEQPVLSRIRDAVERTFAYMEASIGEYHYEHFTLALVSASHAGGIEFPGLVALHSPRGGMLMTRLYESLVTHETVHQWFYGMIGSDQIENPWMDESIASFFTLKIIERNWGERANLIDLAGFVASQRDMFRSGTRVSPGVCQLNMPTYAFPGDDEYFATIYTKGALIVETFDNLLGDSLSDVFWRHYFEENLFARPGPGEFIGLAGRVGGEKIQNALNALINEPVELDLAVSSLENRKIDSVTYEADVLLWKKGALPGSVDYRLVLHNGDTLEFVWRSQHDTEKMTFSLAAPVSKVIIDPNNRFTVDANLLNNSLSADGDSRPALRVSSGIMFLIESFLSFMGGM
ncbi:MAG: hypothetical protein JSU69_10045 [Candidatus Zixiibacteriota bacterium]|nr:MAG: hypothetical protein JSU69_10045 [candidate division Zixibacteria bacterium]